MLEAFGQTIDPDTKLVFGLRCADDGGPEMLSSVVGVCPCQPLLDTGVLAGVFKHKFKLEVMAVAVMGNRANPKYCYYDATQSMKDQTLSDVEQAVLSN